MAEEDLRPSSSDTDVWKSSRAGNAIQDLNQVDKVCAFLIYWLGVCLFRIAQPSQDIAKLLSIASTSISLLSLPELDGPEDDLPQGDERSEQFVDQAGQYFALLEDIQIRIKASIATVRHHRINPSVIDASAVGAVPPTFGVGLPTTSSDENGGASSARRNDRGLQESKVERDAWKNLHDVLAKMKAKREAKTGATTDADMS